MDFLLKKNIDLCNYVLPEERKRNFDLIQTTFSKILYKGYKVVFIGISGGFASGKTQLSRFLHKNIERSDILSEINFFKLTESNKNNINKENEYLIADYENYSKERRKFLIDKSSPKSFDYDKFYETLINLSKGISVKIPLIDEDNGTLIEGKEKTIDPNKTPFIIIDGDYICREKKLKDLLNFKIFKEVEDDVRLSRLVLREKKFLKKDKKAFELYFDIYKKYIKTSFDEYIEPYKDCANIVLPDYSYIEDNELEIDETLKILLKNLTYLFKDKST